MSETVQISFSETGDLLIPVSIRERLHLSPGMTLVVEKGEQGGLRLRVRDEKPTLIKKDGVLVARVQAVGNLSDLARHERDRRVFDLLQRAGM